MAEVEWKLDELKAFAKHLNSDKDGRALKKQMESQFDSITESLRDKLREELADLPGAGRYPQEAAESVTFKTKLIGGKNARVSIVGEGRTSRGKWREIGTLLERGFLYHPVFGRWLSSPPPSSLRQDVPAGPQMLTNVLAKEQPVLAAEIRSVLNDYLEKLADIRRA